MQFSLDHKQWRHKQNQCSASDFVSLIFTRSYRSTLLIATPTTTPSLVKTSLYWQVVTPALPKWLKSSSTIESIRRVVNPWPNHLVIFVHPHLRNKKLFLESLFSSIHHNDCILKVFYSYHYGLHGWRIHVHLVIGFCLQLFPSRYDSTRNELISDEIGVAYSIQNGIPNLIPHDGRLIKKNGTTSTTNNPNQDS